MYFYLLMFVDPFQSKKNIRLSNKHKLSDSKWGNYTDKISKLSSQLSDIDIPMSYHEHMGTIIQTEKDIDLFLNKKMIKFFYFTIMDIYYLGRQTIKKFWKIYFQN